MKKSDIVRELIAEFPDASTHTLAAMAVDRSNGAYTSFESARSSVRYYRGSNGNLNRSEIDKSKLSAPSQFSQERNYREIIPRPIDPEDTSPVCPAFTKALVMCDVHVPYHDMDAVTAAIDFGIDEGCDLVVLNGDIMDFYALSSFSKDPRERSFPDEIDQGREFLSAVRCAFPDAKIIYKLGNHEERWQHYLSNKAPDLVGVDVFEISAVLGCGELDIDVLDKMRHVRLGNVNVLHGHEFGRSFFSPVNPARGLYLRARDTSIVGHYHQISMHSEANMSGKVTSCWSVGCLCGLRPRFMPYNKWAHGFAIVSRGDGPFGEVKNMRITDGRVVR